MRVSEPLGVGSPLMTLRHAAAKTSLSATTLRRYIKQGRLKARLIPGRYGPEYVVDDEDLREAELMPEASRPRPTLVEPAPVPAQSPAVVDLPVPAAVLPPNSVVIADAVPGLLYRELLMKHEQLLVQFGMLRVSGQQIFEYREEAEHRAREAQESAAELAAIRDRHAREIGLLKTRLRQAELEIAARDDEIVRLQGEVRKLEIASRNMAMTIRIDELFARRLTEPPAFAMDADCEFEEPVELPPPCDH